MRQIPAGELLHPDLHWWLCNSVASLVQQPARHPDEKDSIKLEPLLCKSSREQIGPRDLALGRLKGKDDIGVLLAFDVWWRKSNSNKANITKGFVAVPQGLRWFHDNVLSPLPPQARAFYQVLAPEKPCAWYFDIDCPDPEFDMPEFLQKLFHAMAKELLASWDWSFHPSSPCRLDAVFLVLSFSPLLLTNQQRTNKETIGLRHQPRRGHSAFVGQNNST